MYVGGYTSAENIALQSSTNRPMILIGGQFKVYEWVYEYEEGGDVSRDRQRQIEKERDRQRQIEIEKERQIYHG